MVLKKRKLTCESCGAEFDCNSEKGVGEEMFWQPEFATIFGEECIPFCSEACKEIFDDKIKAKVVNVKPLKYL